MSVIGRQAASTKSETMDSQYLRNRDGLPVFLAGDVSAEEAFEEGEDAD